MPAVVVQSNFNHHWDFFFRKTNSMDHLLLLRLLLLLFWEQVTAQQNNAHINTDVVYLQHQPHLLSFLPYTPVERLFIKDNVEKLLQVYVNRERKMERLGSSVDPLARISNLDAAGMTDSQFHFAILDIFTSLRDLHSAYTLPPPYSCYKVYYPVKLNLAKVSTSSLSDDASVVVAESLHPDPNVNQVLAPFLNSTSSSILPGDILVSINGKSFSRLYSENIDKTGGANRDASQRALLKYFYQRSGSLQQLPNSTHINYTFTRNSLTYAVSLPLVASYSQACVLAAKSAQRKRDKAAKVHPGNENLFSSNPATSNPFVNRPTTSSPPSPSSSPSKAAWFKELNNLVASKSKHAIAKAVKYHRTPPHPPPSTFPTSNTFQTLPGESDVEWMIQSVSSFQMGIIKIKSFVPFGDETGAKALSLIRQLLLTELAEIDCLLFDIRGNTGGKIDFADSLAQFFIPIPPITRARLLLFAPINDQLLLHTPPLNDSKWAGEYRMARRDGHQKFTRPLSFDTEALANFYGQIFFKPVAVFTDATCYSSCDLFVANMKDSGAAVMVFGEDSQTGGGGANVVSHQGFFSLLLPEVFKPLPERQDMRIGWRQTLRLDGSSLIEDDGVSVDVLLRPLVQDFVVHGGQRHQLAILQYTRIAERMKMEMMKAGEYVRPSIDFSLDLNLYSDRFLPEIGSALLIPLKSIRGLDLINVMDSLNSSSSFKLQPSSSFSSSSPLIPTTLAISPTLSRMLERFTFTGFDVDGRLLLRSHRYIRFIPRRPITFTSLPWSGLMGDNLPVIYNYFDTVNPDSNSDSLATVGWKRLRSGKSSLVIQDGLFYSNNVKSTASYFFNVTSDGAKIPSLRSLVLDISANYDTEEGCDFLTARLLCYHQVTPSTHPTSPPDNRLLFSVSGSQGRISRSFGLVNHISASCNVVELQITFESDEAVMGGRVEVQNIEIRKDKDE